MILAYRHLGLTPGLTLEGPVTRGPTVAAVAIPLRKATASGRAQDFYEHPCRELQCGGGVRVDLTIQRNFLELRCCPLHGLNPLKTALPAQIVYSPPPVLIDEKLVRGKRRFSET